MPNATLSTAIEGGGLSISQRVTRTGDHPNPYGPIAVPAAQALSSWVKTDANTAAGNLAGGHGLATGTFDVYWTGGRRYGVACTITINAVALEGGTGTDFPSSANTTVVLAPRVQINTAITGNDVQLLAISLESLTTTSTARGHISMEATGSSSILELDAVANSPIVYDVAGGVTNPITGDVAVVTFVSQESTSETVTVKILSLEDSTP